MTLPPNPRCAGITVNGAPPKCCEVHLLPWSHDRADHGMLGDTVAPDPINPENKEAMSG